MGDSSDELDDFSPEGINPFEGEGSGDVKCASILVVW